MTYALSAKRSMRVVRPLPIASAAKPPPQRLPRPMAPPEQIAPGSVLLKADTILPPTVDLRRRREGDWELVRGEDGFSVDCKLRAARWHLQFIVPPVKVSAIGVDAQTTFAKALRQPARAVEAMGFNRAEVTAVNRRRWLGLQYVSITDNSRHAQERPYMRELDADHRLEMLWISSSSRAQSPCVADENNVGAIK